ncbi:MAG: enoyl-CoA hydratase/isomerase family protein [Sphingobium sp.]|nr:enoyl-CoA hydratase/isomerase family protein [Sphingobium sp.]MBP6112779.1 enoyl-CoA hydratase/isomerase family protein [Sphingobium sp.]MBP8669957.1 enoyl-CoA hydratase/isomerase family protein [Sphingobium sp.]MBP9158331.1 enoyl-CoA hydratase/isomerase family protein [Sphingobium sp.]MCC6482720.1 enoyl-CoA hydratase/isomerase family protein [Sphingomonadaceae bacterium]
MSYETLIYGLEAGVATITLNRPERMNALSFTLLTELAQAVKQAQADRARALVLTGAGGAFCSGADLIGDGGGMPDDLGALLETYYRPAVQALADADIPVISAINGPAVGAGLSFALAADIVVMARSAYLMLAFANIGLVPDAGATWLIAKSAGRAKALEMALLGEKVAAEQALDLGLVTRLADDETVLADAMAIATKLARGPSVALGMIRKQVAAAVNSTLMDTFEIEKANQRAAGHTRDFREAVNAFAEKRKPDFRGE